MPPCAILYELVVTEVCFSSCGIIIFFIPKKEALRIIAPKLFALPILSSKIACSEFFFHSEISFFETDLIFGKSIMATTPW